jgi:hypothetical protein
VKRGLDWAYAFLGFEWVIGEGHPDDVVSDLRLERGQKLN